jgi:hypothetical protein
VRTLRLLRLLSLSASLCGCGQLGFEALEDPSSGDDGSVDVGVVPGSDGGGDAGGFDAGRIGLVDGGADTGHFDATSADVPSVDGGMDGGTVVADAGVDTGAMDSDAGAIDAGPRDAGSDSGPVLGRFGAERPVPGLESRLAIDDPTLSTDELLIVYNGGGDLWMAERTSTSIDFGRSTIIAELSTGNETTPELSPDGLTLYFGRAVAGRATDIFLSRRAGRADGWGAPVLVSELSTIRWEGAATPTYDPNVLLFVRDEGIAVDREVFIATRVDAGRWTGVALDSPVNGPFVDTAPFLTRGGTLYITTTRAGGGREIWRAAPNGGLRWFAPEPVTELNGAFDTTDPWVSTDERRIYYVTNESGAERLVVRSR